MPPLTPPEIVAVAADREQAVRDETQGAGMAVAAKGGAFALLAGSPCYGRNTR